MSAFSSDWLSLREPADMRSRNRDIANAVSAWFGLRDHMRVLDLGSGTGSNLRASAPLLCARQTWTLVDNDADLLKHARTALRGWADTAESASQDALLLKKGHAQITVSFHKRDLSLGLGDLAKDCDLVTASALFDLVSASFIRDVARTLAQTRTPFYAVLTYNGLQKWTPHRPADNPIAAAFNRHQMSDKGFGPAAGPMAPSLLADQFRFGIAGHVHERLVGVRDDARGIRPGDDEAALGKRHFPVDDVDDALRAVVEDELVAYAGLSVQILRCDVAHGGSPQSSFEMPSAARRASRKMSPSFAVGRAMTESTASGPAWIIRI